MDADKALLLAHDRPGPRYTSYPTVPHWSDDPDPGWLHEAVAALQGPISVYVHVPFCAEQCLYCGCNMVVSGLQRVGDRYLDTLQREIEALPLPRRPWPVQRIHLGGGTPTWLIPDQLERLFTLLEAHFAPADGASISLEADPAVTTLEHLDVLARHGGTRISLGVQSFDEDVLAAVRRPQSADAVRRLVEGARARGLSSVNLDLMYGLPQQTPETLAGTLARVLDLAPDRLAVFGYAHVPWMKPHQRQLDADAMADAEGRLDQLLLAHRTLLDAGYQAIGFDHFALPDDPLAIAAREGHLYRDFMGYTVRSRAPMLGLGPSAISQFDDRFVQLEPKLGKWWKAVDRDEVPLSRGLVLSDDDRLRQDAILELTCNGRLDLDRLSRDHDVDARALLAPSLAQLAPLEEAGLVEVDEDGVQVQPAGRLLVRNVAMAFDASLLPAGLEAREGAGPRFSRVI